MKFVLKFIKKTIPLTFVLSIYIVSILYGVVNKPNGRVHSLITVFDQRIPFIKEFIIIYVSWYFFIYLTLIYLGMKDRKTYYKTLVAYNAGLLICFGIFLLFQTTIPRPTVLGNDIFSRLVKTIYTNDKPYNCFPSIHVMTSFLMIKAMRKSSVKNKVNMFIVAFLGISIIISTLFVKQHVILDLLSGIILGEIVYTLVDRNWSTIARLFKPSKQVKVEETMNA